jgi:hypothetical protein
MTMARAHHVHPTFRNVKVKTTTRKDTSCRSFMNVKLGAINLLRTPIFCCAYLAFEILEVESAFATFDISVSPKLMSNIHVN